MANKTIGNQKILSKYQQVKRQLESSKDALLKKCNIKMNTLQSLVKYDKNKKDEERLAEAMGRVVEFKNKLNKAWNDSLNSDFLDK